MEETREAATLNILTFWVGPFLLGIEADQVARLPRLYRRELLTTGNGTVDGPPVMDLYGLCGLEPPSAEEQLLVVDRDGEEIPYGVDRIGDLITVEVAKHIRPLPPLLEVQKRWQQLWGVCQWRDDLVLLVDLEYEPGSAKCMAHGEKA
jgi:hypothetical protein